MTPLIFKKQEMRVFEDSAGSFEVVAKDVVEGIGATWNGNAAVAHIPAEWKGVRSVLTPGGTQEMVTLLEAGVYFYLNRSDKPDALPMQKWVSGEVLPSIRKNGSYSMAPHIPEKEASQSGLPEFRRARALDLATKTAERIVAQFPSLSEQSRQVVFAKVINPVAGTEILALPHVEHKTYSAEKVGAKLGISAQMVGRIANAHGLKTDEYGRCQLDKSRHSSKQVETFVYNDAGIEAIKHHMDAERSKSAPGHQQAEKPAAATDPQGALL